jgi:hypothetical protein
VTRTGTIALALGLALLGSGDAATLAGRDAAAGPAFAETQWPFRLDQWGSGRAYRCAAPACAGEVLVFVRPKSGFCNCYNGVADDDEIDRIGDVDLHSRDFLPLAPGHVTRVGDRAGRQRAFRVATAGGPRQILSIVVASRCNALVATVVSTGELAPAVERAVFDLLEGAPVQRFITQASVEP